MAPSAPTCLSTGGSFYNTSGLLVTWLFWSNNELGNGTFAKLEFCTGAACSGFTEFDTAPTDTYNIGYSYDPCTSGYGLRSQYEVGILQTLQPNTLYRFRIRNEKNGSFSSYSNIAELTTVDTPTVPPPGTDTSVPNAPTLLILSGSGNTIDLSWTDNADNENGFSVEKRTVIGGFYTNWTAFATVSSSVTSYSDTGLLYDTVYNYRVRAYNDYGYSDYSNEAARTTDPLVIVGLETPTLVSAVVEIVGFNPQVKLTWLDNSSTETSFLIERRNGISGTFQLLFSALPDSTTYTDVQVQSGHVYSYRIRAYRSSDTQYSAYSNIVTVSVLTTSGVGSGIARHFDGSPSPSPNDYLMSPNGSDSYGYFSWAGWVTRDYTGTRNGLTGRLWDGTNGWSVYLDEFDNFCLRINSHTSSVVSPDLSVPTYLAVTFDPTLGSNQVKFYAGTSIATIALIGQVNNVESGFSELGIYGFAVGWITFGDFANGGAISAWNGSLDQVGVWHKVLSLSEIKQAAVCNAIVANDFIKIILPITGDSPELATVVGGVDTNNFTVHGTTLVPGFCSGSGAPPVIIGDSTGYGIEHCLTGPVSVGGVIRDNQMGNNSLGNFSENIYTLPGITVDNPGTEFIYIRRGQLIYDN